MKNGKHKVRVEVTVIANALVIYKNGVPQEIDDLQEVLDICDFAVR